MENLPMGQYPLAKFFYESGQIPPDETRPVMGETDGFLPGRIYELMLNQYDTNIYLNFSSQLKSPVTSKPLEKLIFFSLLGEDYGTDSMVGDKGKFCVIEEYPTKNFLMNRKNESDFTELGTIVTRSLAEMGVKNYPDESRAKYFYLVDLCRGA